MTAPPNQPVAPELRTLKCEFGLTDYSEPVEAAKEYMRNSGMYYTRQNAKRFILKVKIAWDAAIEDAQLKSRFEDPTGYEAVRRVLAERRAS